MKRQTLASVIALLLLACSAKAHDYWLAPASFYSPPEKAVTVRLFVGDGFKSEAQRPFQKQPTVKFQLFSARDTLDLAAAGEDGKTPVARITPKKSGNYVVALERAPQHIKLNADKFYKYLKEEVLDAILEQRRKSGDDKKEGRERYSRYLKCLLQVGKAHDDTCKRVLGQRLEIVPQCNPYELKAGDTLTVRVLFEGKPLAGAKLFAHHQAGDKVTTKTVRTGKDGTATIKLDKAGSWLLRLVHMRPCTGDADADWESFWAACSFGLN